MFKAAKLLAVCLLALAVHAAERPRCASLPGAEQLWTRPGLRFIIVGETHGTTEAPAIFADLICSAREVKRPIIVGIELRDQPALDIFMGSGNDRARNRELLSAEEWKGRDGRTSTAMLTLLERLRVLKRVGIVSEVVAFSTPYADDSAARGEERMASALLSSAVGQPDALVVALSGNVHACKTTMAQIGNYGLMASFLPPSQTVSLVVRDRGGRAWNCQDGACGPHALSSSGGEKRSITFASPHPCFDGILSTGLSATASRPASQ